MIQNGWLTGWFVVGLCWIYYHRNHVISIPSHLFPHRNDPWHLLQFFSQELWRSILQGLHQMLSKRSYREATRAVATRCDAQLVTAGYPSDIPREVTAAMAAMVHHSPKSSSQNADIMLYLPNPALHESH